MSLCAPREILRTFLQVVLLAVERLDVAGPVLAVDALHRLALVLGVNGHELALLPSVHDERNRRQRQRTDMRVEILAWRFSRRHHKETLWCAYWRAWHLSCWITVPRYPALIFAPTQSDDKSVDFGEIWERNTKLRVNARAPNRLLGHLTVFGFVRLCYSDISWPVPSHVMTWSRSIFFSS